MAAQKENLLSFGNLTSAERNTLRQHVLTKRPVLLQAEFSTPQSHQTLRAMKLQQRWQELKERELTAKKYNRQLLQQFEEAQDRLGEMLNLTANMKTIRKEYERYLEENSPRWEQQLKEQTQAAHRRRMEECLRSCVRHTDGISKSLPGQPQLSQGSTEKTQNITASQSHTNQNLFSEYTQHDSFHLPFMSTSWLSHPQSQTSRFPIRAPYQSQPSSHAPQSVPPSPFLLQPPPFPLPNLASTLAPDWESLLPHHLWATTTGVAGQPMDSGALCGPLQMEEHPPERVEAHAMREGAGTSRSSSSHRGGSGGSRRSHLSHELDIKPVRLSSGHAESSESSRESDQATQERRKKKRRDKRERSQSSSSGGEAPSSRGSSGTSSAIIFAPATEVQSSESDASSKRSSRRSNRGSKALAAVSPRLEIGMKEGSKRQTYNCCSNKEKSQSPGEEVESPNEKSRSETSENLESGSQRGDESESVSAKIEDDSGDKTERDEKKEEEPERELSNGDGEDDAGKENRAISEEREERGEDNEASGGRNTTEKEDGTEADDDDTGTEDEIEEQESVKEEGISEKGYNKMRKLDTGEVDAYGSEGGEDESEADGESDEDESGESGDEAEEPEQEGDSDDSIIAPEDNRAKKIYVIPEAAEDEEEDEEDGSKSGSSDDDSNGFSDDDIENLLAPQDQSQKKEEKEKSAGQKPKATCHTMDIFQVEQCRATKENLSDSDEFDHFYD